MGDEPNAVLEADGGKPEAAEDGQPGAEGTAELKRQLELLSSRYEESSKEGKRLAEKLRTLEESSSLKQNEQPQQAQPQMQEEDVVRYLMENGDYTERQARQQAKRDLFFNERMGVLEVQNKALQNQLKFNSQQFSRTLEDSNPGYKEAKEFFKDNALISALPIQDQYEQFNLIKSKIGGKVSGRDLSAVKGAAGGIAGAGGTRGGSVESLKETQAKDAGFPSWRAMDEFSKVSTDGEHAEWKRRWKIK